MTCSQNGDAPLTVKISYPAILLHATQRLFQLSANDAVTSTPCYQRDQQNSTSISTTAIYLQLDPKHEQRQFSNEEDVDMEGMFDLFIVPPPFTDNEAVATTNGDSNGTGNHTPEASSINSDAALAIYNSLTACADLWPDDDDDSNDVRDSQLPAIGMPGLGDGGMPGEGGWITAENADQFQDLAVDVEEETGADGVVRILGPGAGTRRNRGDSRDIREEESEHVDGTNGDEKVKQQRTS